MNTSVSEVKKTGDRGCQYTEKSLFSSMAKHRGKWFEKFVDGEKAGFSLVSPGVDCIDGDGYGFTSPIGLVHFDFNESDSVYVDARNVKPSDRVTYRPVTAPFAITIEVEL